MRSPMRVRRLAADPAERSRLGAAACRRALEHFIAERMVAAYEELWREELAAPHPPRLRVPPSRA
jgi:glycosyltransferase involved in cell wall biosynthesis